MDSVGGGGNTCCHVVKAIVDSMELGECGGGGAGPP